MADVIHIHVPIWQLLLLVSCAITILTLAVAGLRRWATKRNTPGETPDWSVPPLTITERGSMFHRWDVRIKIVTILGYSFMVASLKHLAPALAAVAVSLAVLVTAKATWTKVALRLLAVTGFLAMILLVMPFTVPTRDTDMVLVFNGWTGLGFNVRGLILASTIAAKAVAIALLMEPLIATAPLPNTLYGLSRLGVPDIIAQMVLLSYRYLHVFRHEARRMSTGMQVRGFRKRSNLQTLRAVANFLGMLFVRSFERTERVFDAMRARGYNGRFPEPVELRLQAKDLSLMTVWLFVGVALLAYDWIGY